MATRRRGGSDIDDLKARLGIKEEDQAPEEQQSAEGSGDENVDAAAAARATASDPDEAPHAPVDDTAHAEDYSQAVHDDRKAVYEPPSEEELAQVEAGAGPSLMGLVIVAVIAAVAGLVIGFLTSSVSDKNSLYNGRIQDAAQLLEDMRPVAGNIASLRGNTEAMTIDGYKPEFDQALRGLFKSGERYSLTPNDLSAASSVLAIDEELAQRLIAFAVNAEGLKQQVDRHLAAVQRDTGDLESEAAGAEDEKNYAIIFDSSTQGQRWEAFTSNPEENAYQPIGGLKVTYESLEVETVGEGDDARYQYTVRLPGGNEQKVPLYEVVPLAREQLVERSSSETATSRYVGRARRIKEALDTLAQQAASLTQRLEEESGASERFSF